MGPPLGVIFTHLSWWGGYIDCGGDHFGDKVIGGGGPDSSELYQASISLIGRVGTVLMLEILLHDAR